MDKLPNEIIINILSFLCQSELLLVTSKSFLSVYRSNVVWRPMVVHCFGEIQSSNYFKEYAWQLKLKRHQLRYKRQWTLGCLPKTIPPKKEDWSPAIF